MTTIDSKSPCKILLTGVTGQLGYELKRTLTPLGSLVALNRKDMDLSNPGQIREVIRQVKPNIIVNAAAYTAVDKAEKEIELARAINQTAPGILAEEAEKIGAPLIHFSTDYVFDGKNGGAPYTEEDPPHPMSVYGKTKLEGERAIRKTGAIHLIFRTSWMYGTRGKNFLLTIQQFAGERDVLRIVDNQFGAPTWCASLAESASGILKKLWAGGNAADISQFEKVSGIYHLSCQGKTSWYGFARSILEKTLTANVPRVVPIPASQYPTPAPRPENSLLSNAKVNKVFGAVMPHWEEALTLCLAK